MLERLRERLRDGYTVRHLRVDDVIDLAASGDWGSLIVSTRRWYGWTSTNIEMPRDALAELGDDIRDFVDDRDDPAHPLASTQDLTGRYPPEAPARAAQRRKIFRDARARAEAEAARFARSPKCADGRHAYQDGGCANDGSTCLCECHDQDEQVPPAGTAH